MFDRTFIAEGGHVRAVNTKVNIHRAPTDESVRLLKEMETAARDKIIESVAVRDNGFEDVMHFASPPRRLDHQDKSNFLS